MNTLQNISRLSHIEIISMLKILQNLHSFKVLVIQSHLTLCDHMDYIAWQAPLSMELSRQEYWSELPFPSSGDLPDPGI